MHREAEGLEPVGDGFRVRLRYGKGLRDRFLIRLHDEDAARRRATKMRELADMLAAAELSSEAPIILKKAGDVGTDAELREVMRFAEGLCAKSGKGTRPARKATFRELAERWTK